MHSKQKLFKPTPQLLNGVEPGRISGQKNKLNTMQFLGQYALNQVGRMNRPVINNDENAFVISWIMSVYLSQEGNESVLANLVGLPVGYLASPGIQAANYPSSAQTRVGTAGLRCWTSCFKPFHAHQRPVVDGEFIAKQQSEALRLATNLVQGLQQHLLFCLICWVWTVLLWSTSTQPEFLAAQQSPNPTQRVVRQPRKSGSNSPQRPTTRSQAVILDFICHCFRWRTISQSFFQLGNFLLVKDGLDDSRLVDGLSTRLSLHSRTKPPNPALFPAVFSSAVLCWQHFWLIVRRRFLAEPHIVLERKGDGRGLDIFLTRFVFLDLR